jgi:hypothetical protein
MTTHNPASRFCLLLSAAFVLLCGACALWLAVVIAGLLPPINVQASDSSAPGLLPLILSHVAIGGILFVGVIGSGLAVLSYSPRRWQLTSMDQVALSLLVGLVVWLVTCVAVRIVNGSGYVTLLLMTGLILVRQSAVRRVLDWRGPDRPASRTLWTHLVPIFLLASALSMHFAALWRLPSEYVPGTLDLGDLAYLTGAYRSLQLSVFPWASLAVEGEYIHPFNQLQDALALAFGDLPDFDISMFLTASMPMFFTLACGLMVAVLMRYRTDRGQSPLGIGSQVIALLVLCAALRYPSWVVETPPMAFAAPLAISVVYLIERGRERPNFYYVAVPAAVLAFALSKVTMVTVLGAYGLLSLALHTWRRRSAGGMIALAVGGVSIGIFATILLVMFWAKFTSFATSDDVGPPSFHAVMFLAEKGARIQKVILKSLPSIAYDVGVVLLVLGAWRSRNRLLGVTATIGAGFYFGYAYLFSPTATAAFIVVGCSLLLAKEEAGQRHRRSWMLAIAALAVLWSYGGRDPGGWMLTAIWVASFGGVLAIVLRDGRSSKQEPGEMRTSLKRAAWRYVLPVAILLSAIATATGDLRFSIPNRAIVPAEVTDLWLNLRRLAPTDALVFTDQTGEIADRLHGWNDFSMIAGRQFFISSWATSFLRGDTEGRHRRLEANEAILKGTMPVMQIVPLLHRSYGSYFAAVSADYPVPASFERLYTNGKYSVYRIP